MRKKIMKLFYFCFLFLPIIVKASNIEVTSFESSIELNKNRTISVVENYNLYFITNTNSFDRTLDKTIELIRKDDSKIILKPEILDINSKNSFEIKETDKKKSISLDIKGIKDTIDSLELSYKYNFGRDESRKYDELFYNIISNFDNIVSDVSFEIFLPSDVEINDIDFLIDGEYLNDAGDVTYDIDENVITGYLNKMLSEKQTFSIRIEFPNGYFTATSDNFNYLSYLFLVLPLITLVVVIIYWFKYGKGNKANKKYAYYPPNDFDPIEIGYLYKGKLEETDIATLLIYLANNSYLKIEENDDGYKLGKENSFNFIKNKNYKKRNACQKVLFQYIFKDRLKSTLSDIEYTIKDGILDVKNLLDNRDNKQKLFNININKAKLFSMLLLAISIISITITPVREFTGSYWLVPVLSLTMIFGLSVISIINARALPKIVLGIIFIGGTVYLNIYSLLGQNKLLFIYLAGTSLILIATYIYLKLPLRTKYGNQKLGEVEGFRIELINMKQNKLKEILAENSNYFYDMIPYAIIFGILDSWISLGNKIVDKKPDWHISKENFDLKKEARFIKNVVFTTTQVMIKGLYNQTESSQLEFKRDAINQKLNQ